MMQLVKYFYSSAARLLTPPHPIGIPTMNRNQNLEAMAALNAAYCSTSDPTAQLNIHRSFYLHQIIEALLSENTDSLLSLSNHG
jgi:hypothetical protein